MGKMPNNSIDNNAIRKVGTPLRRRPADGVADRMKIDWKGRADGRLRRGVPYLGHGRLLWRGAIHVAL